MDKLIELEGDEMSKIKFRVWDKVNNIMLQLDNENKEKLIDLFENAVDLMGLGFQHYPNTEWMLSTGLKDKNNKGKEIFEGDIVEFNNCNYLRTGGYLDDEILRGKVIFAYGGWMIKTNKGDYDLYQSIFNDEELEVIGNVFEDSHLLEEQNG